MPVIYAKPESVTGDPPPFNEAKRATAVQVVAIVAGVFAMGCAQLMWRDLSYTDANLGSGVSFEPNSITLLDVLLSVLPGGAAALVALVALPFRGRARWLRYVQIGLWLMVLAGLAYIARVCGPLVGLGTVSAPLGLGEICGVGIIVLLIVSLRRSASRLPRWHLAFIPLAVVVSGVAFSAGSPTGSGILTGIVAKCPVAGNKAAAWATQSVTVSVQDQAEQAAGSQSVPFRTSGTRYRMRLPTGTYSITVDTPSGGSVGDTVFVPANQTNEEDFDGSGCIG